MQIRITASTIYLWLRRSRMLFPELYMDAWRAMTGASYRQTYSGRAKLKRQLLQTLAQHPVEQSVECLVNHPAILVFQLANESLDEYSVQRVVNQIREGYVNRYREDQILSAWGNVVRRGERFEKTLSRKGYPFQIRLMGAIDGATATTILDAKMCKHFVTEKVSSTGVKYELQMAAYMFMSGLNEARILQRRYDGATDNSIHYRFDVKRWDLLVADLFASADVFYRLTQLPRYIPLLQQLHETETNILNRKRRRNTTMEENANVIFTTSQIKLPSIRYMGFIQTMQPLVPWVSHVYPFIDPFAA